MMLQQQHLRASVNISQLRTLYSFVTPSPEVSQNKEQMKLLQLYGPLTQRYYDQAPTVSSQNVQYGVKASTKQHRQLCLPLLPCLSTIGNSTRSQCVIIVVPLAMVTVIPLLMLIPTILMVTRPLTS